MINIITIIGPFDDDMFIPCSSVKNMCAHWEHINKFIGAQVKQLRDRNSLVLFRTPSYEKEKF